MQKLAGKLIGTSNEKLARLIGRTVTIDDITHGDCGAHVSHERNGNTLIIVVTYKKDIYELEKQTQTVNG